MAILSIRCRIRQVERLDLAGYKVRDAEPLAIPLEKTSGTHDPSPTPFERRERAHGQCGRHPTFELDRHDLMVGYVVVACVDAAPVLTIAQCTPYPRFRQIGRNN